VVFDDLHPPAVDANVVARRIGFRAELEDRDAFTGRARRASSARMRAATPMPAARDLLQPLLISKNLRNARKHESHEKDC